MYMFFVGSKLNSNTKVITFRHWAAIRLQYNSSFFLLRTQRDVSNEIKLWLSDFLKSMNENRRINHFKIINEMKMKYYRNEKCQAVSRINGIVFVVYSVYSDREVHRCFVFYLRWLVNRVLHRKARLVNWVVDSFDSFGLLRILCVYNRHSMYVMYI